MENDGIRCLKKLFHTSIVVLLFLQCFNPSLSSGFYNVSSGFGAIGHRVVTRCIESDREALLAFKQGLVDDYDLLSSWGREEHKQDCCKWFGVHCSNRTNHVTQLKLGWSYLRGAYAFQQIRGRLQGKMMSPKLIDLQHLKYLDLSWINFDGRQIPDFIGSLSNLRHLNLDASFGGQIPTQIRNLTHLQYLDLGFNNFAVVENLNSWLPHLSALTYLDLSESNLGNVPDWMKAVNKLPKLTNLILSGCNLPSPLIHSSTLFNINSSKSLAYVDLSRTQLTSSIFVWLSKFSTSLVELWLSSTDFKGSLPDVFGNMSSLAYLDLRVINFATVENLNSWLSHLSALTYLDLRGTNLSNVPDWMEVVNKLPKLTNLSMSSCSLPSPPIPSRTIFSINSSKYLAHVDLSDNQLTSSSIFVWLSNFSTSLVQLDLSRNNIKGSLPDVFGNMSSLAYLGLSDNQIEGGIPQSFSGLCNLQEFHLDNNNLSGQLSSLVQILMSTSPDQNSLETLALSINHLSGSIPNLTNFSSLKELLLSGNQLSGIIPESIGHMSRLEGIYLDMNALEGVVSESHFSNLSRLRNLYMSDNSLSLNFSSNWTPPFQLELIYLSSCMVGPHFPKWLQTQKSYWELDISNAGISDILPSWFWSPLSHLDEYRSIFIDLSNNRIRGTIPNSRFEFPDFNNKVNLSWNRLESPVPSFLSTVMSLDLSNNKLSGLISFMCPKSPNKVSPLAFLDLSSNNLYEQLPNCWTRFESLAFLDLSDNALFGKIPTTMGSLPSIQTLKLNKNGFVGELPSSLKNFTGLSVFDVGENNLSGLIPEWLGVGLPYLAIVILRSNHFHGSIPLQLCNMRDIQILDFSMNNISGNIPKCINNLTNLAKKGSSSITVYHNYNSPAGGQGYFEEASLIWKGKMSEYKSTLGLVKSIHLSSNRLTGEIPIEITDLVGLVSLNLSRNNLTGQLTPMIGKLESLQSLDLSRNHIHGGIPTSLFQIYGLGDLDLSNNNLSGKIPMGTQLQIYDPSAFAGNPLLCGIPLQQLCSPEETSPEEQPMFGDQVEENDGLITTGFYLSLVLGFVIGFWGVCGSLIFIKSWRYTYYKFLNSVYDWLYVRVALIRRRRTIDG